MINGGKFEVVNGYGEVFTGATEQEALAKRREAAQADIQQQREADPERARAIDRRLRELRGRQRDVIDVRRTDDVVDAPDARVPTPEQRRRARYVLEPVVDRLPGGRISIMGKAYQRRPKFETIKGLTDEDLRALRHYRATFDRSEASEVKSPLDVRPRGSGTFGPQLTESIAAARAHLRSLEWGIGPIVDTLRAVALNDASFRELAMQRFGSREVSRIIIGKGRARPRRAVTLEPKSNTHRDIIRAEWDRALPQLVANVRPYLRTGD